MADMSQQLIRDPRLRGRINEGLAPALAHEALEPTPDAWSAWTLLMVFHV